MKVNAADFRINMSDYFGRLPEEDIYITRHGKVIAIVTDPEREERKRALEASESRRTWDYLEKIIQLMEEIKAAVLNRRFFITTQFFMLCSRSRAR